MDTRSNAETFARETDRLLTGAALAAPGGELAIAARLVVAPPVLPDPAFAETLRAELLSRFSSRVGIRYAAFEAPFGQIFVAHRNGAVVSAGAARDAGVFERNVAAELGERPVREEALPDRLARDLAAHLRGSRRFSRVDLSHLRPFQRRVLEKAAEIPRGELRPYSWIAREIGAPGATRAVGTALGRNPIPFIIPCHRVVRADGSLGEYSGGGPEMKVRVLRSEGVPAELLGGPAPVYRGSRTTHIFCYPTCRAARRIQPANGVTFSSAASAQAAGYRPCTLCRPVAAAS